MGDAAMKAIGHRYEDLPVSWTQRDLVLYAVGIGARADELPLAYELDPSWAPFPTYPLVLGLKGDSNTITDYAQMSKHGGEAPGLPKTDPKRLVHAEQSIEILRPIPHTATGWKLKKTLSAIHDKGKGLILEQTAELVDEKGEVYVRTISSSFNFGKYGLGISKSISKPILQDIKVPKDREPDFTLSEKTSAEQALIYRLSGDYNPLHIDPSIGKGMGFPGVILHGLCSYGHAARAIVKFADGKPDRLTAMTGRFTSPVIPGDTLTTRIWVVGDGQLAFTQTIDGSGKVCLAGAASIKPKTSKL